MVSLVFLTCVTGSLVFEQRKVDRRVGFESSKFKLEQFIFLVFCFLFFHCVLFGSIHHTQSHCQHPIQILFLIAAMKACHSLSRFLRSADSVLKEHSSGRLHWRHGHTVPINSSLQAQSLCSVSHSLRSWSQTPSRSSTSQQNNQHSLYQYRCFSDYHRPEDDMNPREVAAAIRKLEKRQRATKLKRREQKKNWQDRYRLVDRIRIRAAAGPGGSGSLASDLQQGFKIKPNGGHGGAGGSIVVLAHEQQQELGRFKRHLSAAPGGKGGKMRMMGRSGRNLIIRVPCGVVVKRILDEDEEWDEKTKTVSRPNRSLEDYLVTKGGYRWKEYEEAAELARQEEEEEEALADDGDDSDFDSDFEDDFDDFDIEAYMRDPDAYMESRKARKLSGEKEGSTEDTDSDDSDDSDESDEEDDEDSASSSSEDEDSDTDDEKEEDEDDYEAMFDPRTGRKIVTLADLDVHGSHVLVARGGRGGLGSLIYGSSHKPVPPLDVLTKNATPEAGEVAYLELELKLIADIGLVGFPNAGKSSLLRAMSRATSKVAPYPFTTLHPLVGVVEYRDGFRLKAADIPGLIAGASEGRGCGHDFLRHIERTKALLYIVDIAGTDGRDPVNDLQILVEELASYKDGDLMHRKSLLLANKVDLMEEEKLLEIVGSLAETAESLGLDVSHDVLSTSMTQGGGLELLSKAMREIVVQAEEERNEELMSSYD